MKDVKAFQMAKEAAELDFNQALLGLLAGHSAMIERARREYADLDAAFLSALVLSKKGTRLGCNSGLEAVIRKVLSDRSNLAPVEQNFLANTNERS